MKPYVIADTHFNHKAMIEKGYRPPDYARLIMKSLRSVPAGSLLIHLGDVCVGNDLGAHELIQSLTHLRKVLVKGNHDMKSDTWYLDHGWNFVCESFTGTYFGKNILFTHRPETTARLQGVHDLNIHGHMHEGIHRDYDEGYPTEQHLLISLEIMGYKPVSLEKLLK